MTSQLTILFAEGVVVGGLVLLLFWLRRLFGLTPLFVAIGGFQYLQVVLAASVYVELFPGVWVSPGSVVLFPATIFAVLLVYVQEDAHETRRLAYGVLFSNVALFVVAGLAGQHLAFPGHQNPLNLHPDLFSQGLRITAAGTLALFLDIIATIVAFEFVSRWTSRSLFAQVWAVMMAIMAFDSTVFATGAFLGESNYVDVLVSGLLGKAVFATCYALFLVGYARAVEMPGQASPAEVTMADAFQILSYKHRYEHARSQMTRDALTGLFNRGYFDEYAPKQFAHANRNREPTSLAMIDADNLKAVNDRYGHQAGDRLICLVAEELKDFVRKSDTACRYGGDEFAVILTSADGRAARIFADRLLDRVVQRAKAARLPFPWETVTVTVGLATYPLEASTVAEIVALADARLYEGKRAGGSRVTGGVPVDPSVAASAPAH